MDLLSILQTHELVAGDGAMGTQLIARGLPPGTAGEAWNLERPHVIEAIQREYVAAGAQCLLTNTFGGNAIALARHGLEDRLREINEAAAQIARKAADGKALVLGDLGPTGALLEPVGTLSCEQAHEAFQEQTRALVSAGVDAIIAETFESAEELHIALSAAREACELPLMASMMFQHEKSGRYRTSMGDEPARAVEVAEELGCVVVGTNCGQGISSMIGLVAEMVKFTDIPLIAQPNAGLPELVDGKTVYRETPATFAKGVPDLYRAGARIIGGCCGTTPEHIRAVRSFAEGAAQQS